MILPAGVWYCLFGIASASQPFLLPPLSCNAANSLRPQAATGLPTFRASKCGERYCQGHKSGFSDHGSFLLFASACHSIWQSSLRSRSNPTGTTLTTMALYITCVYRIFAASNPCQPVPQGCYITMRYSSTLNAARRWTLAPFLSIIGTWRISIHFFFTA